MNKEAFAALDDKELAELSVALVRDIPDAVIYADREGRIRVWNAGAQRIFGYSEDEAIGQSLDIIIPERLRKRHWDGYDHMMKSGESAYAADAMLSVPAQTRDGESLSIEFTVAPVHDEAGQVAGIIAVLRDVTATFKEMKRLRKLVKQQKAETAESGTG